jgi:hypothetical protein
LERVFWIFSCCFKRVKSEEVKRRCMPWNAGNAGEGDLGRTAGNPMTLSTAVLKSAVDWNEEAAWIGGKAFTKRISGGGHEGYMSTM